MGIAYWGYSIPIKKIGLILKSDERKKEIKIIKLLLRNQKIDQKLLSWLSSKLTERISKRTLNLMLYAGKVYDIGNAYYVETNYPSEWEKWLNSDERKYFLTHKDSVSQIYYSHKEEKNPLKRLRNWYIWKKLPKIGTPIPGEVKEYKSEEDFKKHQKIENADEKEKQLKKQITWLDSKEREEKLAEKNLTRQIVQKWGDIDRNVKLNNSIFKLFGFSGSTNTDEMFNFFRFLKPYEHSLMIKFKEIEYKQRETKFKSEEDIRLQHERENLVISNFSVNCIEDNDIKPIIFDFTKTNKVDLIKSCSKKFSKETTDILKNMFAHDEDTIIYVFAG